MKITINKQSVTLPDFLLVGAGKAGSTALFTFLRQNPDIFLPAIKEPNYFCYEGKRPDYSLYKSQMWKFDRYCALFESAPDDSCIGECSIVYLMKYQSTIRHIKKMYGDGYKNVKIMMMLRNPVDRLLSHFVQTNRMGLEKLPLMEAVSPQTIQKRQYLHPAYDYIEPGMYFRQVKAYLREFPLTKVILYDDYRKNPSGVMKDIFEFLGVRDISPSLDYSARINPGGIPKNRAVYQCVNLFFRVARKGFSLLALRDQAAGSSRFRDKILTRYILVRPQFTDSQRKDILAFYVEDIKKLGGLLDVDLSSWLTV